MGEARLAALGESDEEQAVAARPKERGATPGPEVGKATALPGAPSVAAVFGPGTGAAAVAVLAGGSLQIWTSSSQIFEAATGAATEVITASGAATAAVVDTMGAESARPVRETAAVLRAVIRAGLLTAAAASAVACALRSGCARRGGCTRTSCESCALPQLSSIRTSPRPNLHSTPCRKSHVYCHVAAICYCLSSSLSNGKLIV